MSEVACPKCGQNRLMAWDHYEKDSGYWYTIECWNCDYIDHGPFDAWHTANALINPEEYQGVDGLPSSWLDPTLKLAAP